MAAIAGELQYERDGTTSDTRINQATTGCSKLEHMHPNQLMALPSRLP